MQEALVDNWWIDDIPIIGPLARKELFHWFLKQLITSHNNSLARGSVYNSGSREVRVLQIKINWKLFEK